MNDGEPLVLYSSGWGIIGGYGGGLALIGAGVYSVSRSSIGVVIGVLGVVLVAVMLFDVPLSTRFDRHGFTRRMVLRRQIVDWDRVDRLGRTPPPVLRRRSGPGGLLAWVGRRRYLLCDRCESRAEYRGLRDILEAVSPALADSVAPPTVDRVPTSTYRRRPFGRVDR